MVSIKEVWLVRDKNKNPITWLRNADVAEFVAQKNEGTIEKRKAVIDLSSRDGNSALIDKEIYFWINMDTHEREYRLRYNEHKQTLKEKALLKIKDILTEEELSLLK